MALPKNSETARGRYLESLVQKDPEAILQDWPWPTRSDLTLFGGIVTYYNYIDFQLWRTLEVLKAGDLLEHQWKRASHDFSIGEVERAVKSARCWSKEERKRFEELFEFRSLRNLITHFTMRRFPTEDAFVFMSKSARDFKERIGFSPERYMSLTYEMDISDIKERLSKAHHLANWMIQATNNLEEKVDNR